MRTNKVTWLQISDLHVFEEADTNIIMGHWRKLSQKIKPCFIIATGDYRHLGAHTDYDLALKYLEKLAQIFNVNKADIYLIPGNHDINDYPDRSNVINNIIKAISGKSPETASYNIYSSYMNKEHSLLKAFSEYKIFVHKFYDGVTVDENRIKRPETVFCSSWNNTINIIHINTSLISDNDRSHGEIFDVNGLSQCEIPNSSLPTIAIGHNYPSDIHPAYFKRLKAIFQQKKISAYLCGDVHLLSNKVIDCDTPYEEIRCYSCPKSAPQSGDDYSDIGCIYYSMNNSYKVEWTAYSWKVEEGFKPDPRSYYNINKKKYFYASERKSHLRRASNEDNAEPDVKYNDQDINLNLDKVAQVAIRNSSADDISRAILMQERKNTGRSAPQKSLDDLLNHYILNTDSSFPLAIYGTPGTGKSTLLTLLYNKAKEYRKYWTFFINVQEYSNTSVKKASLQLKTLLSYLDDELPKHDRILLFIDGINQYIHRLQALETQLRNKLDEWQKQSNVQIIYTIVIQDTTQYPPFSRFNEVNAIIANHQIKLLPIDIKGNKYDFLVRKVLTLKSIEYDMQLKEKFKNLCILIDDNKSVFRTINFLADEYTLIGEKIFELPVAQLIYSYYQRMITKKKMIAAAQTASDFLLEKPEVKLDAVLLKGPAYLDFFFALNYVEIITDDTKAERIQQYDCIFTNRINRFVKQLIHISPVEEDVFVKNLIAYYGKNTTIKTKIQIVYFLGRVAHNKNAVKTAKDFLTELFAEMINEYKTSEKSHENVMLLRSVGISLLYLGCVEQEDVFYSLLIYDEAMNRINRDFHVAYYSEISYKLKAQNVFDKKVIYSKENVRRLYSFLYHSVGKGTKPRTRNINIITLISLVIYWQYRFGHDIQEDLMAGFTQMLDSLSTDHSLPNIIQDYIVGVKNNLLSKSFFNGILEKLYSFKSIRRKGWEKREIYKKTVIESDADHSWMCCMIANVLLTENIYDCELISDSDYEMYKNNGYSKQEIINILLVHDIPEIITGDIASTDQNADDKKQEADAIKRIRALGAFPYLSSLYGIAEQCNSFWPSDKKDASINVRIASDIDKLEPLIQLYFYRQYLKKPYDYQEVDKWIKHPSFQLYTSFGSNLYELLESHMLNQNCFSEQAFVAPSDSIKGLPESVKFLNNDHQ